MTKKRFVNKGKDIFQYGEWWCSANGEHCADVIATAINELIEENGQLKIRLNEEKEKALKFCRNIDTLIIENEQLKMGIDSLKLLVQNWEALDEEKDEQLDRQNQSLKKLKKKNERLNKKLQIHKSDGLETLNDLQRCYENTKKSMKRINVLEEENEQLKKFIDKLYKKYEDAHGMNIENTDWF